MNRGLRALSGTAFAASVLVLACGDASAAPDLALRNVTVIDVTDGTRRADQTVVIDDGRIADVGPVGSVRDVAARTVVDGRGRFVIPGLWDMHGHLFMGDSVPTGADSRADATSYEFWRATRGPMADVLLAHGVTGVRDMWGSLDVVQAYEARRDSAGAVGPRVVAAGGIVSGRPGRSRGYLVADSPARAEAIVDSLHAAGADFIKVYPGMSTETFAALGARAGSLGLPVSGHIDWELWLEEQIAAGQREFSHAGALGCVDPEAEWQDFEEVAGDYCQRAVEALTSEDVWVTPTLTVYGAMVASSPEDFEAHTSHTPEFYRRTWNLPGPGDSVRVAGTRERLRRFQSMVAYFHRRGIPMMAGTDFPFPFVIPGYSLHQELLLLERAGLTPLEALQSATLEPARFLMGADSMGVVEEGYVADLVVLAADPLVDIRNTLRIEGVVVDGQWLDRAELDRRLREAARRFAGGEEGGREP